MFALRQNICKPLAVGVAAVLLLAPAGCQRELFKDNSADMQQRAIYWPDAHPIQRTDSNGGSTMVPMPFGSDARNGY